MAIGNGPFILTLPIKEIKDGDFPVRFLCYRRLIIDPFDFSIGSPLPGTIGPLDHWTRHRLHDDLFSLVLQASDPGNQHLSEIAEQLWWIP